MKLLEMSLNVRQEQIKDWQRSVSNQVRDQIVQDDPRVKRMLIYQAIRIRFKRDRDQVVMFRQGHRGRPIKNDGSWKSR